MDLIGLCSICGKPGAMNNCSLCGRIVCHKCFNGMYGICVNCKIGKK